MKPIISRLSAHSPLFFFPLLLVFRSRWRKYILFLFGALILAGCYNKFYKTGTTQKVDAATIERLKSAQKFFIIHFRDDVMSLSDVSMNEQFLSGKTGILPAEHTRGLSPGEEGSNTFKENYRNELLSEVHLYVNKNKSDIGGFPEIQVPVSDLYRMDIYEFDEKRTQSASTISTIGIVGGAVAIIAGILIIATTSEPTPPPTTTGQSCGCPQVYVEQQGDFKFQNGLFSGAVFTNLERTDYLPLRNVDPDHSSIHLRISGHDNEVQYLNTAKLVAVYHQPGTSILADRFGKFYAIKNPETPEQATGAGQEDLLPLISSPDDHSFEFTSPDENDDYASAYLTFKKPANIRKARLLIRAKNSNWSASVNQEYTLLTGSDYNRYRNFMEKKSRSAMESVFVKQGLPIKVYVENNGKWDAAGYFPTTGTEGYRDMVMEINLPENQSAAIRVKLETVYRFWDLDHAAIDYADETMLQTTSYDPVSAIHTVHHDQAKQLAANDKLYTELNNNESLDLLFKTPGIKENKAVSYFLASGGYYHIRDAYPVKANISRLKAFKNDGEFNRFSKEKYRELEAWQARLNWLNNGTK